MRDALLLALALVTWSVAARQSPRLPASTKTTTPGVSVELATLDGRTTYHMGEEISLLTRYRSTLADRYLLETAICGKFLATADTFNRSPGKTQSVGGSFCLPPISIRKGWPGNVERPQLAVDTRRVKLGPDPVELWSPGYLNYSHLGDHTVNITSHRVYPLDAPPVTATTVPESPYQLTSNTLHITIVPADEAWQHSNLTQVKPILHDRSRKDPPECHWLRELTSHEATVERIYQIRTGGPCRDRTLFHTPFDMEELHKLFSHPKFPVTTEVLDQLAYGFVLNQHPELNDFDNSDLSSDEYSKRFDAAFQQGRRHYTDELLALLPGKAPVARPISSQTAHVMDKTLRTSGEPAGSAQAGQHNNR